ncbi:cysteine-rich CWC family protein [Accumulibacter sp.]|uniref:cysteine-rich CWC family protein n=2 Tax=Betaproteobacteria incertae sedis TaxID=119066 RepID=UPI00342E6407
MVPAHRRIRRSGTGHDSGRPAPTLGRRRTPGERLSTQMTAPGEQTDKPCCVGCGAPFLCGAAAGLVSCWCMDKPALGVAPESAGRCYCPVCLEKRLIATARQSAPAT